MADATFPAALPLDRPTMAHPTVQAPLLTPGKVAMWLFLATEVMFFTGLIGTYIVLRAGSPPGSYSNLYPPNTNLGRVGPKPADLVTTEWPRPYDHATNPLNVALTAGNTLILIVSSVFMALALRSFQRDDRRRGSLYLTLTALLGTAFLGVQVYEYYQLLVGHHYPIGVSASGHFRPDSSLFASCFFTMTGAHGLHVAAGIVAVGALAVRSWFGAYSADHYNPVENVGLYWHFVDLVWSFLFAVVYLI